MADPSNQRIRYTEEALEAGVEGMMLLKCTITVEGRVRNCRIIKSLEPSLDETAVETVQGWKFAPVTFRGHAVAVDYVVPVRFLFPRQSPPAPTAPSPPAASPPPSPPSPSPAPESL